MSINPTPLFFVVKHVIAYGTYIALHTSGGMSIARIIYAMLEI